MLLTIKRGVSNYCVSMTTSCVTFVGCFIIICKVFLNLSTISVQPHIFLVPIRRREYPCTLQSAEQDTFPPHLTDNLGISQLFKNGYSAINFSQTQKWLHISFLFIKITKLFEDEFNMVSPSHYPEFNLILLLLKQWSIHKSHFRIQISVPN